MATEAAEHASGGGFPPFEQIDTFPSQIFWLAITFGVLYFVLSKVFLPKIQSAIANREEAIAADLAGASALNAQAENSVKAFEAQISEARARARDTASKAKAEADARVAAETKKVEAELATRLAAAETRISELRATAMGNVATVAEDVASDIVEKLTGAAPDAARVKQAVAAALS